VFIVAIDPGLGTGISTYNTITGEWTTRETFGFEAAADNIFWLIDDDHYETEVVCENFIVTGATAKKTQQPEPLMLIGVAKWITLAMQHKFTLQQPAERKAGEKLLKKLGWYVKTKDGHSNSASGHLVTYCLRNNLFRPEEKMKLIVKS
jgi:hypothetical protein